MSAYKQASEAWMADAINPGHWLMVQHPSGPSQLDPPFRKSWIRLRTQAASIPIIMGR